MHFQAKKKDEEMSQLRKEIVSMALTMLAIIKFGMAYPSSMQWQKIG